MNDKKKLIIITVVCELILMGVLTYIKYKYPNNSLLQIIFKEIILIPMFVLIAFSLRQKNSLFAKLMLLSFIIIALADAAIVDHMLAGMIIFSIAHLTNGINFTLLFKKWSLKLTTIDLLNGMLVYFVAFFLYFQFLFDLKQILLSIVTMIYCVIIAYAVWRSLLLYRIGNVSFGFIVSTGAILFYFCDFQVAYSEFILGHQANVWSNNMIYYTGLYLLGLSSIFQDEIKFV